MKRAATARQRQRQDATSGMLEAVAQTRERRGAEKWNLRSQSTPGVSGFGSALAVHHRIPRAGLTFSYDSRSDRPRARIRSGADVTPAMRFFGSQWEDEFKALPPRMRPTFVHALGRGRLDVECQQAKDSDDRKACDTALRRWLLGYFTLDDAGFSYPRPTYMDFSWRLNPGESGKWEKGSPVGTLLDPESASARFDGFDSPTSPGSPVTPVIPGVGWCRSKTSRRQRQGLGEGFQGFAHWPPEVPSDGCDLKARGSVHSDDEPFGI